LAAPPISGRSITKAASSTVAPVRRNRPTAALAVPGTALAQEKPTLRLSSVVSDNDIRAEAFAKIAEAVSDTFDMQVFNGATLVAQGTEMTAIQRGNLEMGLIAPQTIAEQIPEWSIVTSAYLFSDAAHLDATFDKLKTIVAIKLKH